LEKFLPIIESLVYNPRNGEATVSVFLKPLEYSLLPSISGTGMTGIGSDDILGIYLNRKNKVI
jgi:hypothetical protein